MFHERFRSQFAFVYRGHQNMGAHPMGPANERVAKFEHIGRDPQAPKGQS
jgi:hypothetical protein